MRKIALLLVLLAGACVVHERVPPPPPPAPPPRPAAPPPPAAPAPRELTKRDAVRIATDFVRKRGLEVQRYKARRNRAGQWLVELRDERGVDRARVLVDGRSGRVVRAKLHDSDPWED